MRGSGDLRRRAANSLAREVLSGLHILRIEWSGCPATQRMLSSRLWQARSQRRQASAQARQWACMSAC